MLTGNTTIDTLVIVVGWYFSIGTAMTILGVTVMVVTVRNRQITEAEWKIVPACFFIWPLVIMVVIVGAVHWVAQKVTG